MSGWTPPNELPDLRNAAAVAVDVETKDEGLRDDRGSGWPWKGGYICGVAVAWRDENGINAIYIPVRHPDSKNLDREQVIRWLRDLFASKPSIVTHNGLYDYGWLWADFGLDMPPAERLEETGALATIIDENRHSYKLDALCKWRGIPGKDETLLRESCIALDLVGKRKRKSFNPQVHIWQLPAACVVAYAEQDPISTLLLYESLNPILDKEDTHAAYRLECDLLPMVHKMRRRGIRIDSAAAEYAQSILRPRRDALLVQIGELLDAAVTMKEIRGRKWLSATFDRLGITYPRTKKGNPSFKGGNTGWMKRSSHPLPPLIAAAIHIDNYAENFLGTQILDHIRNGRVYAEINPHRGESGGTRSFRFSYAHPPLQQMPKHDEELAPLIRGVFLPEESETWATYDISQQEFRFIVHYAVRHKLPRAQEAAEAYRNNPGTDFHLLVSEWTKIERQSAKNTNFAKCYGAGVEKFAEMIQKPVAEAREIYNRYDRELPFVSRLSERCQQAVWQQGYLTLYGGARRHWNKWAAGGEWEEGAGPCDLEEAKQRTRNPAHKWFERQLYRVDVRLAMNALIQGSSAYHTKLWMRECHRAGIIPLLQMHDALELSVPTPEQTEIVAQLGCNVVADLEVPMKVDVSYGRTWGDAKHTWEDLHPGTEKAATSVHGFTPSAAPAHINGAQPALSAAQSTIEAPPAIQDRIFLADIIDETIPRSGFIHCRFHDDREPSLKIYDDHYHCFGCGAHGNAVNWLVEAEGLDRDEAIDVLESWDRPPMIRPQAQPNQNQARALELWKEAKPIPNTLATQYLVQPRCVDLDALPKTIDETLRFHPSCPFGPRTRHPCLIALMRDALTDAPCGIQRIALTPAAAKIDRRMLGQSGVVKLWAATTQLVVGEGLETVLAAASRLCYQGAPLQPAWAVLSAPALRRFPIIPGVERLVILADHDRNGVGQAAAEDCKQTWLHAGRRGAVLLPDRPGSDFNDLVIARWSTCHD